MFYNKFFIIEFSEQTFGNVNDSLHNELLKQLSLFFFFLSASVVCDGERRCRKQWKQKPRRRYSHGRVLWSFCLNFEMQLVMFGEQKAKDHLL